MEVRQSLEKITKIIEPLTTVNVLFAIFNRKINEVVFKRLDMTLNVSDGFKKLVVGFIADIVKKELVADEYYPGFIPQSDEICFLDITRDVFSRDRVNMIPDPVNVAGYDPRVDNARDIQYYAIIIEKGPKKRLYYFRTFTQYNIVRKRGKLSIIFDGNVYTEMEEDVLVFDNKCDCLLWGNKLYVFNQRNFENIFNYDEALREYAKENIDRIIARLPVDNPDEFRDVCIRDKQIMRKMAIIERTGIPDEFNMEKAKEVAERYNLGIKIDTVSGKSVFIFDPSVAGRWKIIRFLEDGFLKSEITNIYYEVSSKRPLRKS